MSNLVLDLRIYDYNFIKQAANDFAGFVNITVEICNGDKNALIIFDTDLDKQQLFKNEFVNYLIQLTASSI